MAGQGRKKDAPNRSALIRKVLEVVENAGKTNEEIAKLVEESVAGVVCTAVHVAQLKANDKAKNKPAETVVKEIDVVDFAGKVKAAGGVAKVAEAVSLVANLLALPYIADDLTRIDDAVVKYNELKAALAADAPVATEAIAA